MDKIDRRIFKDDYTEANRELINKCIMKLDELVEEYETLRNVSKSIAKASKTLQKKVIPDY